MYSPRRLMLRTVIGQTRRIVFSAALLAASTVLAPLASAQVMPGLGPMGPGAGMGGPGGGPAIPPPTFAQTKADVEFGLLSQRDPHPLTYTWGAEVQPITDPGPYYYYFYYTGTVEPDARVQKGNEIRRIPVPLTEWTNERKTIIAKLTYFYQVANNIQPSALDDYSGQTISPEFGANQQQQITMPGQVDPNAGIGAPIDPTAIPSGAVPLDPNAPIDPNADPNAMGTDPNAFPPADPNAGFAAPVDPNAVPDPNMQPMMPGMQPAMPGMMAPAPPMMPGMPGPAGFQFATPNLGGADRMDPRAVAEWTFYLDQFVLWQYYCTRNLLRDQSDSLIDEQAAATGPEVLSASGQQALAEQFGALSPGGAQATGGTGRAGSVSDTIANRPGASGGIGGFIDNSTGDFYAQRGAASGGAAAPGGDPTAQAALREVFDLTQMQQTGIDHRDRFIDAAKANEQNMYNAYMEMINRIEQRELNQEQYDQWIEGKRQQIFTFAENWRKLNRGEAQVIGDTMFLVTEEPLESVPYDAINIVKSEQVTPQDLINRDGSIKRPVVR